MGSDITVVSVEEMRMTGTWRVHFSEPVYRRSFAHRSRTWHIERSHQCDELAAYLWGLKVIEEHKERIRNG